MLVTIMCDASFCPETNAAGFGYWIASNRGSLGGGAAMKEKVLRNELAEMMAAVNSLHIAVNAKLVQPEDRVLIQSDCLVAIHTLQGSRKKIKEEEKTIVDSFEKLRDAKRLNVYFKHVKAHSSNPDARYVANNLCDKRAKAAMKIAREKFQSEELEI